MSLAFRKILVPTDFSETAETALYYAEQLARQFDGELHVLHVCEDPMLLDGWPRLASGPAPEVGEEAAALRAELKALLKSGNGSIESGGARHCRAADGPGDLALCGGTRVRADRDGDAWPRTVHACALGKRGGEGRQVGAVPRAHHSPPDSPEDRGRPSARDECGGRQLSKPVERQTPNIEHILCAVDLSDVSAHAIEQAIAIAGWYRARITAVHVYTPLFMPVPGLPPPAERVSESELQRVREQTAAAPSAPRLSRVCGRCRDRNWAAGSRDPRLLGSSACRPHRHGHPRRGRFRTPRSGVGR